MRAVECLVAQEAYHGDGIFFSDVGNGFLRGEAEFRE